jgi:hypothetical protein
VRFRKTNCSVAIRPYSKCGLRPADALGWNNVNFPAGASNAGNIKWVGQTEVVGPDAVAGAFCAVLNVLQGQLADCGSGMSGAKPDETIQIYRANIAVAGRCGNISQETPRS